MLTRPRVGAPGPAVHELRRERLLEVLHRHSARSLVLLVAPAGFGKSTLAAAYARESGAAVAWLSLHAGDRDSRAFFSRLVDAFDDAFQEPGLLEGVRRGLVEGAEGGGLARLLLADLAEAPAGFILVLDDFHHLQDADEVHQSVDLLVRGLPEMGQIVLTAREIPPLSMTRLVASDAVFALGAEDLRFTDEETRALRQLMGGDAANDAEAEGWVAGILLGGAPRQLGVAGGTLLGAYVEREVLARLHLVEQAWLEALAVVESITPAAAERLLERGPWTSRLESLAERCPFLVQAADGSYRLHGLVRETLLNRLRRRDPDHATRVWTVARAIAEEAYDTVGMVRACQELGQPAEAAAVVRRTVKEAVQAGRWGAALATLDLLAESTRRADPDLSLDEAQALLVSGRPDPARRAAESALEHGGRSGDALVQVSGILQLAAIARYAGDLDASEDWLSAGEHLLHRADLKVRVRRQLEGRLLGLRGICLAVRGRTDEARDAFEGGQRLLALNGPSRDLAAVETNLGSLCSRIGDVTAAQEALAQGTTHWRLIGDRVSLATAQLLLGNLYQRTGKLEAAGATFSGALEAARAVGALRLEAHALVSLGEWHRANGRIADAVAALDESLRMGQEVAERELLVVALESRAELAILQDDFRTAREMLASAQADAQRLGSDARLADVERGLGRLHLAEGAGQRAVTHLEQALQQGLAVWSPYERIAAHYWLGTAYLALGRAHQAEERLRTAIETAEGETYLAALAGPAAEDDRLLRYGIQLGLAPTILRAAERLAERRRPWTGINRPAVVELVARNELPRLEVRLFGAFVVHRDGVLIEQEARRVDRARELLAVLVLHPTGLPDREVAAMLWPQMAEQRALHNLRMAAYLLRRLLGSKAALRYSAGVYQLAPQLELHADVRAFDAALARARTATDAAAREALETGVAHYRGPLLAETAWEWAEEPRLRYQERFVAAASRLSDLLAENDLARSDALCEMILTFDSVHESSFERLAANARARGDGLALRRLAKRYEAAARQHGLGANPRLLHHQG